jgi:hypothetical protein
MAIKDLRTLPPGAELEILVTDAIITKSNFGIGYHGWPNDWNTTYPVPFNSPGTWYGGTNASSHADAQNPFGDTNRELLHQYESVKWIRSFYPGARAFYDSSAGAPLSQAVNDRFLDVLDFWYDKGNKLLWNIGVFSAYSQATLAASISGTTMTVTSATGGSPPIPACGLNNGCTKTMSISGIGVTPGTYIVNQITSSESDNASGKRGTYTVSHSQTVPSTTITGVYSLWPGKQIDSLEHEQQVKDYVTALLTSTRTNPNGKGYTIANHPSLGAVEVSNEAVNSDGFPTSYARCCRIVSNLFEYYKPDCKVITLTSVGGVDSYIYNYQMASAASLGAGATDGTSDDGTGKYAIDYGYAAAHHQYRDNCESVSQYNAFVANGDLGGLTINNNRGLAIVERAYNLMGTFNQSAPAIIKNTTYKSHPMWCTETGLVVAEDYAIDGSFLGIAGFRWGSVNREERFANLVRWWLPILLGTSDYETAATATTTLSSGGISGTNSFVVASATGIVKGMKVTGTGIPYRNTYVSDISGTTVTLSHNFNATGTGTYNFYKQCLGVLFGYTGDISGTTRPTTATSGNSSNGTMSNIRVGSGGKIRFTASSSPSRGWIENMSIVITAPAGGWSDLGMAGGDKKRFEVNIIDAPNRYLEIQGSTFTTSPAASVNYTEFQTCHFSFPEELKTLVDTLTLGKNTIGLIWYIGNTSPGIFWHVEGVGTWYTTSTGEVRQW